MPKILEDMAGDLKRKGYSKQEAYAISNSQLRKHGVMTAKGGLTAKGAKRQALGKAGRAKDRAKKK